MTETCPSCGSPDVIRIIYGLVMGNDLDELGPGPYELAGCIIAPDAPALRCGACDRTWGDGYLELQREDLGPQFPADDPFSARMRLHQSWWRAHELGVPCGTGPTRSSSSSYGNMLLPDDAEDGLNFLTPQIFDVVRRRLAEPGRGVEGFRLLHNLLSSQPLCFNLFGPLVADLELATRLVGAMIADDVDAVTDVRIEWAPTPAADYLDDRTAFDAFVEYRRRDGTMAFVAIETKLTEPFSQTVTKPEKYLALAVAAPEVWKPDRRAELIDRRWFQLWRNHLLADRLVRHDRSPYVDATVVVVRHPGDPSVGEVIEGYRSLLARSEQVVDLPLDRIVDAWMPLVDDELRAAWLDPFRRRYIDMSASDHLAP